MMGRITQNSMKEPVSFDEIVNVDSLDALKESYEEKGYKFKNENSFLNKINKDWRKEVKNIRREALTKDPPRELPSLVHNSRRSVYKIYGVIHDPVIGPQYINLVREAVNKNKNWICENNISDVFGVENSVVEIPDFSVQESSKEIKYNYLCLLYTPLFVPDIIKEFFKKPDYLRSSNEPLEIHSSMYILPYYAEIELTEKEGKGYNVFQIRSAYHAEFLKALKGEEKSDLVGRMHAAEIKHFLKKGVKDQRVIDLAHRHAEILKSDPEKLKYLIYFYNKRNRHYKNIGNTLGILSYSIPISAVGLYLI